MKPARKFDPITYVVVWRSESIVKVGWTSHSEGYTRWKMFVGHGAEVVHLYREQRGSHLELESKMHRALQAVASLAFVDKASSTAYLGSSGGGYLECYRLPPAMLEHVLEHVLPGIAKESKASNATVRNGTILTREELK